MTTKIYSLTFGFGADSESKGQGNIMVLLSPSGHKKARLHCWATVDRVFYSQKETPEHGKYPGITQLTTRYHPQRSHLWYHPFRLLSFLAKKREERQRMDVCFVILFAKRIDATWVSRGHAYCKTYIIFTFLPFFWKSKD